MIEGDIYKKKMNMGLGSKTQVERRTTFRKNSSIYKGTLSPFQLRETYLLL